MEYDGVRVCRLGKKLKKNKPYQVINREDLTEDRKKKKKKKKNDGHPDQN